MAQSPSHKFGQLIGNLLEDLLKPILKAYCDERGLYLDYQGERKPARTGRKVKWVDSEGNNHDLDFVIEAGGSNSRIGRPLAFIEVAWRRYVKHSRNKVQEIQGAVGPIAQKHSTSKPFLGAVLAGVFTEPSLVQLRSHGFHIILFPYETVIDAFDQVGIDIKFDETTDNEIFLKTVQQIEALTTQNWNTVKSALKSSNAAEIDEFFRGLTKVLDRRIERVSIIPLYGESRDFSNLNDAMAFLEKNELSQGSGGLVRIELRLIWSNGDNIEGNFQSPDEARSFLSHVAGW